MKVPSTCISCILSATPSSQSAKHSSRGERRTHHMSPAQHLLPQVHQRGDAPSALSDPLVELACNEGYRFGAIEDEASGEPTLCKVAEGGEDQLVLTVS